MSDRASFITQRGKESEWEGERAEWNGKSCESVKEQKDERRKH